MQTHEAAAEIGPPERRRPSNASSYNTSVTFVSNSKNREVSYKRSIVWLLFHLQGYLQILQSCAGPSGGRRWFRIIILMVKMVVNLLSLLTDEHVSTSKSIKREKKTVLYMI